MTREHIKDRLKLSVLNVTLAVISKQDGDLKKATEMLYDTVEQIAVQAVREATARGKL